jgi:hypothetical protein
MKTCILCLHCYYRPGERGYSEYTPGWDAAMGCGLYLWELDFLDDTEADFGRKMTSAETCPQYDPRPMENPFESDLAEEVLRVRGAYALDEKRNRQHRSKVRANALAKRHGESVEFVETLTAHALAATADLDETEWRPAVWQVIVETREGRKSE